jgi:DNA polymerase-3 subunit delta
VLNRIRQDPIYELTGAVSERDTLNALHYLSSLLSSGYHYLQILTAITNQIRRLLLIKGFIGSSYGGDWNPGMSFDRFKNLIIPAIRQYDEALLTHITDQKNLMRGNVDPGDSPKKQKDATDLIIAKNPNNPYPIYQMFLRSENFSERELGASFEILNQTDVKLKTTGQTPRFVLEEAVLNICRKT